MYSSLFIFYLCRNELDFLQSKLDEQFNFDNYKQTHTT